MVPKGLYAKAIRERIKKGFTVQDFCDKYDCTPDELWVRIGQLFTVKDTAKQVWNEIEANEKKKGRKKNGKAKAKKEATKVTDVTEGAVETAENTTDNARSNASYVPTLEELEASEQEHSAIAIELEANYEELQQKREKLRKDLQQLDGEVGELRKALQAKDRELATLVQKDGEFVDQMNAICASHKAERSTLENIRKKIKEMNKIELLVYSSREIALSEEKEGVILDDTGHEDLFLRLREQEEAEDFRPKDLRLVARVIRIVANLGDKKVNVVFEDDEVEMAYEIFKSA